ncbi:hypothetical protein K9M50_02990 [Patescibacteria group bacterium]|nr:hypothetical protein [Patescibacteria group bacterium]
MSKKKEKIIDEKTKRRNIAMSRRTAQMSNRNSTSVSAVGQGNNESVSMLSGRKTIEKSDVAKASVGFKSVGTKAKSKADNLRKNFDGLGPRAHGNNSSYSSNNNFRLK